MAKRIDGKLSEKIARLRIELQEIEPKIWRRIDMPMSATLMALHEAIQVSMGWTFSHLWEFRVADRCYGDTSFMFDDDGATPVYKADVMRLRTAVDRCGNRFEYLYDFGDSWYHDVIVEGVREGDQDAEYPTFVDGARRCPPEDVGGPPGFEEFLEAVTDPNHEQYEEWTEWYGKPFDPNSFEEAFARIGLKEMARRRRGPRTRYSSKQKK